jgi:glutamate racemase
MVKSDGPIGVFDSGLGGLTVLRSLKEAFPNEGFVYLGDTARLPYGNKSPSTLKLYVEQNIKWLESQGAKAIIVACNSASTVLTNIETEIPVFGVIEPGAKFALAMTENQSIGVIGTRATIQKKAYVDAIHRLSGHTKVFQQACPLLVSLVEEGWDEDPITNLIVYRYLSPLVAAGVDTLILGCTHYPVLRNAIQKVMGRHVNLIESSQPMLETLNLAFRSGKLKARDENLGEPDMHICATDISDSFTALAQRILAPIRIPPIERIDL